jgi:hypothetical protein
LGVSVLGIQREGESSERERERELWRERETEVGVTVREKEGLGLREGGETVTAVAVAVTGKILRTLAMVALVCRRLQVCLPIAPLVLSLDLKSFFFFFSVLKSNNCM